MMLKRKTIALAAVALAAATLFPAPGKADPGTVCYHGDVARGATNQGDWWLCMGDPTRMKPGVWQHIVPFFDPNSTDSYGPMHMLPPLCVRFPQDYPTCDGIIYQFPN
jgi:hypothetical protein